MTDRVTIAGAGMAGLLAGIMFRNYDVRIMEAQSMLPNNHEALLRFRSQAVSMATGIPFEQVHVTKGLVIDNRVVPGPASIQHSNQYSYKVSGEVAPRSILDLSPVDRYIAPGNFIGQMAKSLSGRIEFGCPVTRETLASRDQMVPLISTIPMPMMMNLLDWPDRPSFQYRSIWSVSAQVLHPKVRMFQTLYLPEPSATCYRISVTGDRIICELTDQQRPEENGLWSKDLLWEAVSLLGLPESTELGEMSVHFHKYGKLVPVDESARRAFILMLTDQYNIFSVGRFATWRQIILDDVVADIGKVLTFIRASDDYARKLDIMGET